jgi:hypothetical protein
VLPVFVSSLKDVVSDRHAASAIFSTIMPPTVVMNATGLRRFRARAPTASRRCLNFPMRRSFQVIFSGSSRAAWAGFFAMGLSARDLA